jgi:hypothetical protein
MTRLKNRSLFAVVATIILVAGTGIAMLALRFAAVDLFSGTLLGQMDHEASYQLITFGLFIMLAGSARLLGGPGALKYLNVRHLDGPVVPVPAVGLTVKPGEGWKAVGRNFLLVISLVTAAAVFFQVLRGSVFRFSIAGVLIPALIFAVVNAFIEEGIFRFAVVSVLDSRGVNPRITPLVSGALFGAVHFYGTPGGIPGVFLAGFLGWLLAKSMIETRSFAWAWLIHAAQDVVIFTALFGTRV